MLSNTGVNKIILLGQVTTSPEYLRIEDTNFLCFTLVTTESLRKGEDVLQHNEFHQIQLPEKLIMNEVPLIESGQTVYIEGRLHTAISVDEINVKRYDLSVIVVKLEVMALTTSAIQY
jgi:single-stranded DNA-binding protein